MNKNNYAILFKIFTALFIWVFLLYIHRSVNKKYESFSNTNQIVIDKSDAFCENHRGASHVLEKSCGELTQKNCNSTSCCVWTSNNKCVAGKANGPTYNKDANGKTKNLDYYYYQNKCYGSNCP